LDLRQYFYNNNNNKNNKLVVVIAVRENQDLYHVNIQYIHKVKKTTTATI